MDAPHRAVRLTLAIEADTLDELAMALENIAAQAERNELTTGTSGGCGSGYNYELLQDPEQTHDSYFAQLRAYLASKTPNVLADRPAAPFAAGPATEGSEVERRVGPRETGE